MQSFPLQLFKHFLYNYSITPFTARQSLTLQLFKYFVHSDSVIPLQLFKDSLTFCAGVSLMEFLPLTLKEMGEIHALCSCYAEQ